VPAGVGERLERFGDAMAQRLGPSLSLSLALIPIVRPQPVFLTPCEVTITNVKASTTQKLNVITWTQSFGAANN